MKSFEFYRAIIDFIAILFRYLILYSLKTNRICILAETTLSFWYVELYAQIFF